MLMSLGRKNGLMRRQQQQQQQQQHVACSTVSGRVCARLNSVKINLFLETWSWMTKLKSAEFTRNNRKFAQLSLPKNTAVTSEF